MEDTLDAAISGYFSRIWAIDRRRLFRVQGMDRVSWRCGTGSLVPLVCDIGEFDRTASRTRLGIVPTHLAERSKGSQCGREFDPDHSQNWPSSIALKGVMT